VKVAWALVAMGALATSAAGARAALTAAPAPAPRLRVDARGALFALAGLRVGSAAARCLTVTSDGPGPARVLLFGADRDDRGLGRHLVLTVERGLRPAGEAAGSCDGFEPDPERAPLYRGALAKYPAGEEAAIADPEPWMPGDEHAYRFAIALRAAHDDAIRALQLTQTFSFGARSAPVATTAASCGAAPPRTRLVGVVRVSRRVVARLAVRREHDDALALIAGLRVRGRTLRQAGWARVAYRVDGGAPVVARVRPFRARISAARLAGPASRVEVTVAPRRGRPVRARFGARRGAAPC
jgi:hypothetical protein